MLSEQIIIDRAGNFTASENHKLMAGWDKPAVEITPEVEILRDFMRGMGTKPLVGYLKPLISGVDVTGTLINAAWQAIQAKKPPAGLATYAREKACEELFNYDPSLYFETQHTINGNEREIEAMELLSRETGIDLIHTGEKQIHISADGVGCIRPRPFGAHA